MRNLFYHFLSLFQRSFLIFTKGTLRVLAYHTVENKEQFERQINYVKKVYNIIDIKILEDHILNNKPLPQKPLLITFDDGDISVFNNGLPIIKKLEIQVILFVITDLINSNKPFWWDEIKFYIGNSEGDSKVWEAKTWLNEHREIFLKDLRSKYKDRQLKKQQLNHEQLKSLAANGFIIGNHSHTHPMFDKLTTEEIRNELEKSCSILNSLGFCDRIFAYPNGNFDQNSEAILKEKGIRLAFLFDHKLNSQAINPLRISRIRVDAHTPLTEFKVKVSGLHSLIYNIRNKRNNESFNNY